MTLGAARVKWTINDLSAFVDEVAMGYTTMVLKTERGPIGVPKVISSIEDYRRVFGKKVAYTTDPLVAEMSLRQGGRLNIIRAAHYADITDPTTVTAVKSECTLLDRGNVATHASVTNSASGPYTIVAATPGAVTCSEVQPYAIGTGVNDKLKIRVREASVWGAEQTVTIPDGAVVTAQEICDYINAQTVGVTASVFSDRVKIAGSLPTQDIEILTVAEDIYSTLGCIDSIYNHTAGSDALAFSIDGGTDQEFTLTAGSRTASQIVSDITACTGATVAVVDGKVKIQSSTTGTASQVQISSGSTAAAALGFDTILHSGAAAGGATPTLTFTAKSEGDWGDDLIVYIYDTSLDEENSFDVKIVYNRQGDMMEFYSGLNMDPTSQFYAVNYINERSLLVTLVDENSDSESPQDRPAVTDLLLGVPLTGGDNGLVGFRDSDWIGDAMHQTGMYAADNCYMSMDLMIPGTTSVTVYQAMIAYCENRADMIGYGQVPSGLEPEEVVAWRMGQAPYTHGAFNSHRFTLFFGRPKVYDDFDDSRKYISCLGHLSSCLCKTDNNYGYHYAPVGPRRGVVTLVEGIDRNINTYRTGSGYADLFAEYGINYLFISNHPGIEGAMFWEQRTTQRAASALRELNVVRFITIMNRMLMPVLRTFLFEPNHPVTWREIHRTLEPAFIDWKNKYAIYDFVLQTDRDAFFDGGVLKNAVLNSGLDIDRGIYHCRALIQPTRTIYYLEFTLGVTRTGQAFEEYTSLKELPGWVRA